MIWDWEGYQSHLPEQIKHELKDPSGSHNSTGLFQPSYGETFQSWTLSV